MASMVLWETTERNGEHGIVGDNRTEWRAWYCGRHNGMVSMVLLEKRKWNDEHGTVGDKKADWRTQYCGRQQNSLLYMLEAFVFGAF